MQVREGYPDVGVTVPDISKGGPVNALLIHFVSANNSVVWGKLCLNIAWLQEIYRKQFRETTSKEINLKSNRVDLYTLKYFNSKKIL